jgi:L-fuculose-phosphate aldolase
MQEIQAKFEKQINDMVKACRRCSEAGFVQSQGGNLSQRMPGGLVLITPTMKAKGDIGFDDICVVTGDGKTLYAPAGGKPTGELPFHLRILAKRPDVNAVVHAHPPVLTGFAIHGGDWLRRPYLPEPVLEVGPMVLVPYAEPLSEELAQAFDAVIDRSNGFLMQNHGALMCSTVSALRAQELLEMVEAQAKSLLVAIMLGGARELPREDVGNLDRTLKTRGLPMPCKPGEACGLIELMFD